MSADPHHLTRAQVIALLEERDTLRERVRQLEEALAPTVVLPRAWQLARLEGLILSAVRAASPNVAHRERVMLAVWGMWEDAPEPKCLDTHICRIRRRLQKAQTRIAFETHWGRGWRMDGENAARFDAAVARERSPWSGPLLADPALSLMAAE